MHQPDYRPVPFQAWSGPPSPKSIATDTSSRQKKSGKFSKDFIRKITCPARLAFYRDQANQSINCSTQRINHNNQRINRNSQRINRSIDSVNRRSNRSKCRINQISQPRKADVSDVATRSRMKKKARPISDGQGNQGHRKKPSVTFSDVRQMIGTRDQFITVVTNSNHAAKVAGKRNTHARTDCNQSPQYEHSENSPRSGEKKVASAGISKHSHTTPKGGEKKASSAEPAHCSRNCHYNVFHHITKSIPKKKTREDPEKKKLVQQRILPKAQPIGVGGQSRVKDAKKNSALYYTNESMNKHIKHDLPGAVKRNVCNHNRTDKLPYKLENRKKKGISDGAILFVKRGETKWPIYNGSLTMSEVMHVDIKPQCASSTSNRDISKTRQCRNASFDRRISTHNDKEVSSTGFRNIKITPLHKTPSRKERKSTSALNNLSSNRTFYHIGRSKGSIINSPTCQSAMFYSQKPEHRSAASYYSRNGLGHREEQQQTGNLGYSFIPNSFFVVESTVFPSNAKPCPPSCLKSQCVVHGDQANTTSQPSFQYDQSRAFSKTQCPATKCPIPFTRYPSASSQTTSRRGFIVPRRESQGSFGRGMSKCSFFTCSELHLRQNDSLLLCASEPMKLTPHLNMRYPPLSKVSKRPMSYTTNVTFMDLNMKNEPANNVIGTAIAETETEPPPTKIRLL